MRRKLLLVGLLSLSAAVVWVGCGKGPFAKKPDPDKEESKKPEAIPVEVATLTRGPIEAVLRSSSHLEAEQEVKVFARTSNRVAELLVEEGDSVEKDQVLLRLVDDTQRSQFERAQNNLDKARKEFARQQVLFGQKLISETMFTEIQHELKQLELAMEDARRELEYTEVRAPIAGTLTARLVNLGNLVNVNQHLFDLVDFDSIVARVYLPEKELSSLAVGQPVRVTSTALPGVEFNGHVKRIAPVVESRTGTVKITVGFAEVGQLRPGMYVEVAIVTATKRDALLISKRSLVYDADQIFAYRLGTNRTVERVLVQPRLMDRDNLEPLDGFVEGDQLVVAGQTGLKDGAQVRLPGDPDPETKDNSGTGDKADSSEAAAAKPEAAGDGAPDSGEKTESGAKTGSDDQTSKADPDPTT